MKSSLLPGTIALAVCALALSLTAPAYSQAVLIDFGNSSSFRGASQSGADANGNYWTSIYSGASNSSLVDFSNTVTSLGIGFTASTGLGTDSYNGPSGATSSPITQAQIDAATINASALGILGGSKAAAFDYYVATDGRFTLSGLNPYETYNLTFFGSHKFNTVNTTDYSVHADSTYTSPVGSTSLIVGVSGSNNTDTTATIAGLTPQSSSSLYVRFGASGYTANGYINEMLIVGYVPYSSGTTLSTARTYSGNTVISNSAAVTATVAGALGGGTSALEVDGSGGTLTLSNTGQTVSSLIGSGNLALTTGTNTLTISGSANGSYSVLSGSGVASTYGGILSGSGKISKTGAGNLTLSGSNTFAGNFAIGSGTLTLGNVNALQNAVLNTTYGGSGSVVFGVSGANSYTSAGIQGNGPLNIGANTLNVATAAGSTFYDGVLGGSGTLTKSGSNTLTLRGNNTFTGAFNISGGTLQISDDGPANGGSIAAASGITNNGLLSLYLNNAPQSYGGMISGTGSLTKTGSSGAVQTTLTLTGSNSYSGVTTISTGTLALSGSGSIANSSKIVVAAGATFDVSGLTVPFTLSPNQTLSISGTSATINGAINGNSGKFSLVFDGTNPSFVINNGGITLSASSVLMVATSGSTLSLGTYKIISKGAGVGAGLVSGTAPGSVTVVNGSPAVTYAYALSISGGELYLTVTSRVRDHSVVVMGSSVAQGFGSSSSLTSTMMNGSDVTGYAGLLQSLLMPGGWSINNISIGGQKTQDGLNRFASDLAPLAPSTKYAWLGYCLANEFLQGSADPAGTVATYNANLSSLISQCSSAGFYPVISLNYPRAAYSAGEYEYLKGMNLVMNSWNVPSSNFLGVLDDGNGHWAAGYYYNDTHPNDAGYLELFYSIVPSLFDAINAGQTNSPHLAAATNFARLAQTPGVTAPITFTPANTMHSFTISCRVRSTHNGTIAAIRSGTNDATLEIRGGNLVYHSSGGQEIASSVSVADGGWHDIALAYRYALQQTVLFVDGALAGTLTEQYVPDQFTLGGPGGAVTRPATPAVVDFQNWCVYRSAWNINEAVAQMQGNRQQASMEICAALDDAIFTSGSAAVNQAQSLSVAMINTPNFVAAQDVPAPGNLSAQSLPGSSARLTWVRNSTSETGFVIQRRPAGTTLWSDLVLLPAGSVAYTNTGLSVGISYDYRVAALESGLRGNYSNTATFVPAPSVHQTLLIDFGPNDVVNGTNTLNPDSLGQYWNNMNSIGSGTATVASTAPSGTALTNLITTTNTSTTIGLTLTSAWSANGIANGGLLAPSFALLGNFAVPAATGDYFFTTTSASLNITNLDSMLNYRLRFFGTRTATDTRVATYIVTGGNGV